MSQEKQIIDLLNYAKEVPKESWKWNALKNEISKLQGIESGDYKECKDFIERPVYIRPHPTTINNIFEIAKGSYDLKSFTKKVHINRFNIKVFRYKI